MKKFLLSVLIIMGTAAVFAQVPGTVSYQGILVKTSPPADAGKPVDDGTHFVRFRFFNVPTGGTAVYSSTGTGSGNSVTTYKGMFSFIIGSGSAGNDPVPAGIFNEQLYVEIEADGVTLTPRVPLTTTPYTFRAQTANTATSLTTTLAIAGGGTGATTAAAARTNLGLGSLATLSSVGSSEITDASVATADIADGAITLAKHADNSVNSAKIVDGSVATVDLADNSVTSAKIVDATIATTDLADNSVTSAKIVDGTISNADINASAAIAVTKLASGTNGQVLTTSGGVPTWTTPSAGGTVTSVATGTGLTGGPITTTGTVSIATGGVTTTLLADNSVTSAKIVDGTIVAADINTMSATAGQALVFNGTNWAPSTISSFSTNNAVPRGNGTGMVTSNINSDGTNVGIGSAPAATSRLTVNTNTLVTAVQVTNNFANAAANTGVRADASASTSTNYGLYGNAFGGATSYGVYGSSGTTATSYGVAGTVSGTGVTTAYGVHGNATSTSATTNYGVYGNASGGTSNWAGYFTGNIFASSLYGPSDEKLKYDIRPFEGSSVDVLSKINIKRYKFYEGSQYASMNLPKGEQIGLLAADFEKVLPELVTQAATPVEVKSEDGRTSHQETVYFKAVNYVGLIPILVKAIQEQQEQIASLNARIKELESENNKAGIIFSQLAEIQKEMEIYRSILGVQAKKN